MEVSAELRFEAARQVTKSLSHKGGLGGAVAAAHAKSVAAAEMRNRARAVGVNRAEVGSSSMLMLNLKRGS